MRSSLYRVAFVSILSTAIRAGCGGSELDQNNVLNQAECNPLGGNGCITPWPSNLYSIEDSSTASGRRLDIPEGALPENLDGIAIEPTRLNRYDGFSAAAPIIVSFGIEVDDSTLVSHTNYAASLSASSPTQLIDMSTGERVAHFAELDKREVERVDRQALYIRPAARLTPSTRYAVAIRTSLKAKDGSDLPISPGFAAILSGNTTHHERLEANRAELEEALEAVEDAGVSRDDLLIAWDFTTGSDEFLRNDLRVARERGLAAAGSSAENLSFIIESDEDDGDFRVVRGQFESPLFLTKDGSFEPGTTVARDSDFLPDVQGSYEVPFLAVIPSCAADAEVPVDVILYGHGLLGDEDQVASGSQRALAEEMCAVVIGAPLRGMSTKDVPNVLLVLNDFNVADQVFDTLIQGIIDHLILVEQVRGPMLSTLFSLEGTPFIDIDKIHYYGLSQGGIFGTTIAAFSSHIKRATLGVGAANYSMMLERSNDWPTYRTVLIGAYDDPLNVSIMLYLMQMRWDTTEPSCVVSDMPGELFEGFGRTDFLMQMGVADAEVPNLASEFQARTMGLSTLKPALYEAFEIPVEEGPLSSAIVGYDGKFGSIPEDNQPPAENDAHYITRSSPAARRQIQIFFDTGQIVHTCGENQVCDCTTSACE